jgi:hypothetical protein
MEQNSTPHDTNDILVEPKKTLKRIIYFLLGCLVCGFIFSLLEQVSGIPIPIWVIIVPVTGIVILYGVLKAIGFFFTGVMNIDKGGKRLIGFSLLFFVSIVLVGYGTCLAPGLFSFLYNL